MNEQIKLLAGQALDKVVPYTWTKLDYEEIQKLQEYLAKSVVKECIRELEIGKRCDIYTGDVFKDEYNDCIDAQIAMLKDHFGVE